MTEVTDVKAGIISILKRIEVACASRPKEVKFIALISKNSLNFKLIS